MVQPRLSAGVVVLRREAGVWQVLMLRAYRNWDFPKGLVEAGEDPFAAAVREAEEEADLHPHELSFSWGMDYYETEPYRAGKIARYYLAQTNRKGIRLPVNAELGKPEHDEWRWTSIDAAHATVVPRLQKVLDWVQDTLRRSPPGVRPE